jgi:hypothetical protein
MYEQIRRYKMNSKVVKGLFLLTILGLVGLLAVAGAAVAWAAQIADEAPLAIQVQADDAPADTPARPFLGRMTRGLPLGGFMAQRGSCDQAGWADPEAMRATMHAALADALGITVDELEAALAEGQSPMQLAQDLGLDFDALHEARLAAFDQALEAAVADGRLTQEEADLIRERRQLMQEQRQEMRQWHEENGFPGMGMRMQEHRPEGGRGMMRGGMMGRGMGFSAP